MESVNRQSPQSVTIRQSPVQNQTENKVQEAAKPILDRLKISPKNPEREISKFLTNLTDEKSPDLQNVAEALLILEELNPQ